MSTGFDVRRPDFVGRTVVGKSSIAGQEVQDGHGHGTHCVATAAGPKCPPSGPSYGVASEAEIYAAKVLSDAGSGNDSQILAGDQLGDRERLRGRLDVARGRYPAAATLLDGLRDGGKRAAGAGSLILAAAGNDSRRPTAVNPVSHPANCPSILAVGALDADFAIGSFSNRGINPDGGQVDVAGPGVDVLSSVPLPAHYGRKNGTSMATPHAAGVAALLTENKPRCGARRSASLLTGSARRLATLPSADVARGRLRSAAKPLIARPDGSPRERVR